MGNRSTVIFVDDIDHPKTISPAVYLHWNGGADSIYPFLDELDRRKVRADADYECARFCHVVGDFFDGDETGANSLGITNGPSLISVDALDSYDPGDNGIFVVCRLRDRAVRRFVCNGGRLKELSPDNIAAEKREAERSKYASATDGIPAKFAELRPIANG